MILIFHLLRDTEQRLVSLMLWGRVWRGREEGGRDGIGA